jgi:SAM-dependent methyltransferase
MTMANGVCPWWLGYLLINPLRKLRQNPEKILRAYVKEGMIVLDVGSAMGYFTLPLAKLVGEKGKVIAVDIQERMIFALIRRARKAGLLPRIDALVCPANSLGLAEFAGTIDFALAFAVMHEFPAVAPPLADIIAALKPGGILLIAEPAGHVKKPDFDKTMAIAVECGFEINERPKIASSHAAVLRKRG